MGSMEPTAWVDLGLPTHTKFIPLIDCNYTLIDYDYM